MKNLSLYLLLAALLLAEIWVVHPRPLRVPSPGAPVSCARPAAQDLFYQAEGPFANCMYSKGLYGWMEKQARNQWRSSWMYSQYFVSLKLSAKAVLLKYWPDTTCRYQRCRMQPHLNSPSLFSP